MVAEVHELSAIDLSPFEATIADITMDYRPELIAELLALPADKWVRIEYDGTRVLTAWPSEELLAIQQKVKL